MELNIDKCNVNANGWCYKYVNYIIELMDKKWYNVFVKVDTIYANTVAVQLKQWNVNVKSWC